jgi:glycerol kinase
LYIVLHCINQAVNSAEIKFKDLKCIGITNQRETCLVWHKDTGEPLCNAIVWQCRRSADICNQIKQMGDAQWLQNKTGLVTDPYFSATKLQWLFQHKPELLPLAEHGKLAFGTIDTWLIWQLTGGKAHVTDHTNASRTMLYNIKNQTWDPELLKYFKLPHSILPKIQASASHFGTTTDQLFDGANIAITGVAGDQQAALFGQRCIHTGEVKNTYGTGCFMLMYIGKHFKISHNGLLTTLACDQHGQPAYALEGSVFIAGAAIRWLRDQLGLIDTAAQTEHIAHSVHDTQGVYFVPAFTGLGAPHWNMEAKAAIVGLTLGASKAHIIRAALEAMAYQTSDLITLMQLESGIQIKSLYVDGGACSNNFLMQFQADIINVSLNRPHNIESTALGAILLAGLGAKIWRANNIPKLITATEQRFQAKISQTTREQLLKGWQQAIKQVKA